jgi:hypothetical protein
MIRMGVLDLIHKRDDSIKFLEKHFGDLNEDLKSLYRASTAWTEGRNVNVGESGTLYRFLQFASWKMKLEKTFVLQGTLKEREMCDNPCIVDWPMKKLLELDNGTSQWASASVLMGSKEGIEDLDRPPFKLKLTYEAVRHWTQKRKFGERWEPRYDETIVGQALAFLEILLDNRIPIFTPQQAEDYCFARAFGFMTKEDGEKRWPSLHGHESDRINEIEKELKSFRHKEIIESKDHRVVQAIAMLQKTVMRELEQKSKGIPVNVRYPNAVNKSWPKFWDFLEDSTHL